MISKKHLKWACKIIGKIKKIMIKKALERSEKEKWFTIELIFKVLIVKKKN